MNYGEIRPIFYRGYEIKVIPTVKDSRPTTTIYLNGVLVCGPFLGDSRDAKEWIDSQPSMDNAHI
jgi:hypothetical protein